MKSKDKNPNTTKKPLWGERGEGRGRNENVVQAIQYTEICGFSASSHHSFMDSVNLSSQNRRYKPQTQTSLPYNPGNQKNVITVYADGNISRLVYTIFLKNEKCHYIYGIFPLYFLENHENNGKWRVH